MPIMPSSPFLLDQPSGCHFEQTVEFKEGLYLRLKGKEMCEMMRLFGHRRLQWPLRFHFQMSGYVSCQLRREFWIVCSNRWDCHTAAAWPRTQLADAKSEANYLFTMIRSSFLEEYLKSPVMLRLDSSEIPILQTD